MSETITSDLSQEPIIPAAVRRAAAEAERLAAEATAAANPEPQEPAEAPPPEPPATTVVEQQEPPPAPAEPAKDAAHWERRYRSLQGKYDTEVPAMAAQLRGASARISELEGRVSDLTMQLTTRKPETKPAAQVAPEDVEAYGQEFIDKVRVWAGNAGTSNEQLEQLKQQVSSLQSKISSSQQQSAQDAVKNALNARVPGWETINTNPAYLAWLAQTDPFSGNIRLDLLKNAYANGDAERTIRFFEAFIAEQTATEAAGTPPSHTPERAATVPLADLVAPGRGRPATPPGAQPEKRIWTHPQVAAFYQDVTRGKYRYDEAGKNRLEADIHAAAGEGRIR